MPVLCPRHAYAKTHVHNAYKTRAQHEHDTHAQHMRMYCDFFKVCLATLELHSMKKITSALPACFCAFHNENMLLVYCPCYTHVTPVQNHTYTTRTKHVQNTSMTRMHNMCGNIVTFVRFAWQH